MTSDKFESCILLWDAAADLSRANRNPIERNWLIVMDAFWRCDLAPEGLVYFFRDGPGKRAHVVYSRGLLAGHLLGWQHIDDERQEPARSFEELCQWLLDDYFNQPPPFGDYFQPDRRQGRLGLAVSRLDYHRWRRNLTNRLVDRREPKQAPGAAFERRGRRKGSGEIDDTAALTEMLQLLATGDANSVWDAAGKVAGSTDGHAFEAIRRRFSSKFRRQHGSTDPPQGKSWSDIERELKSNSLTNISSI
jgi:hypothetical protein